MLVLDLPILRDVDLDLVWTVHTLFEIYLFNSQILFSTRSALYSCLRISDFASASNCSFFLSKNDPELTVD